MKENNWKRWYGDLMATYYALLHHKALHVTDVVAPTRTPGEVITLGETVYTVQQDGSWRKTNGD